MRCRKIIEGLVMAVLLFGFSRESVADWITYRPGPEDGLDMWYSSYYSYGSDHIVNDQKLRVGGWGDWYYSFIKFDLGCLPRAATNVWLSMMPYDPADGSRPVNVQVYRPQGAWGENSGWLGTMNLSLVSTWPAPIPGTWWSINITALYNGWQSGAYPNHGLALVPTANDNTSSSFRSSDYGGGETFRPRLVIEYTPSYAEPFKLCFPLKRSADGPYTSVVTAVMDHAASSGVVEAYIWETGDRNPYSYSTNVVGYKQLNSAPFVLPLLNYCDGVAGNCGKQYLFYDGHTGYDYQAPEGVPVYAAAGGQVSLLADEYNTTVIAHIDGFETFYLHMSSVLVTQGQWVQKGQLIGKVGEEGAGGPHLHFTVKKNGVRVDPYGRPGVILGLWDE